MASNLPNFLTSLRMALIPLFVFIYYLPFKWSGPAGAVVFALAGATDWLDGYLARRLNQQSAFGAFLDPVADKLIIVVALVMLVDKHGTLFLVIPALIIIGREIAISALREWMAELGKRAAVAVSFIGKLKTTLQIIALLLLLYREPAYGVPIYGLGLILLYIAALMTLWSMMVYVYAALEVVESR